MLQSTTQKTKEHEHHKTRGYLWNGRQSLLHYWRTSYYAYLVSPGQHNQFVISEVVWTNKSVTNKNQRRTLKSNLVNGKIPFNRTNIQCNVKQLSYILFICLEFI